ncbi:hypothetical protein BT63DRAFT_125528 [Microthyrium microscopicum]|uniref:Uncharacterized protein n=1 Tax=Microthyrium microscopicum TaxID=703497 RepID=A0A6A6TW35_9PEZI|nr:hypothetical protein BT63DRAFT_125528 [Microthyrium microscopicum]
MDSYNVHSWIGTVYILYNFVAHHPDINFEPLHQGDQRYHHRLPVYSEQFLYKPSVAIMLSQTIFKLACFATLGTAHPATPPESLPLAISTRSSQICYDSEKPNLLCYNSPSGVPQNVNLTDVAYIASYLRAYGAQTKAGRLFNMARADAPDCGEWTIYARNSAVATAKHIDNSVNSSVLFADIANTIDGGAKATPEQQAAALISCGTSGGSLGVLVNASNPAYTASTYPTGFKPSGILVKIVAANPS